MLVYYVGGVTFLEVAALRFLSRQREFPFEIVIATTRIMSADGFMKALIPAVESTLAVEQ